jgi:hypothetical protein
MDCTCVKIMDACMLLTETQKQVRASYFPYSALLQNCCSDMCTEAQSHTHTRTHTYTHTPHTTQVQSLLQGSPLLTHAQSIIGGVEASYLQLQPIVAQAEQVLIQWINH